MPKGLYAGGVPVNNANFEALHDTPDDMASNPSRYVKVNSEGTALEFVADAGVNSALSNLTSTSINTSLISDTDSEDDLGSASINWRNLYIDTIIFDGVAQITGQEIAATGRTKFHFWSNATDVFTISVDEDFGTITFTDSGISASYLFNGSVLPNQSSFDLGSSSSPWDQGYIDEIILHNDGPVAAPADSLVISATDLSAGNTMLSINTEGTASLGTGTPTQDRTIALEYNGTTYYLLASTSAS